MTPAGVGGERAPRSDAGAGSVLAIALLAAVICLTAMLLPLHLVFAAKQQVRTAADAAALAAADVRVGIVPGFPCEMAATVAAANGASLTGCELDGLVASVSVSRPIWGGEVVASATAGPPGSLAD